MACGNAFYNIRASKWFVTLIVFMIMVIDSMMTSTMVPILPDMVARFVFKLPMFDPHLNVTLPGNLSMQDMANVTYPPPNTSRTLRELRINSVKFLGAAFAVKPAVEVVCKIGGGVVVDRLGHKMPLILGFAFTLTSLIVFAWAGSLTMVIVGQIIAGIGCAFSIVSGLALLATAIPDDDERGKAMGLVYGGLAVGNTVSFPISTTAYEFLGQPAPFLIMLILTVLDGVLRMLLIIPENKIQGFQFFSCQGLKDLLLDKFIWAAIGYCFLCYGSLTWLGTVNPTWMSVTFSAAIWQIGVIYSLGAVVQFTAQYLTGLFAKRVGRWMTALGGFLIMAVSVWGFSFCTNIWSVLGPETAYRIGLGLAFVSIAPMIAVICDSRHNAQYGTVYGLTDATYSLSTIAGTLGGGEIVQHMSYGNMMWLCGGLLAAYAPVCLAFRKIAPAGSEELAEMRALPMDEQEPETFKTTEITSSDH